MSSRCVKTECLVYNPEYPGNCTTHGTDAQYNCQMFTGRGRVGSPPPGREDYDYPSQRCVDLMCRQFLSDNSCKLGRNPSNCDCKDYGGPVGGQIGSPPPGVESYEQPQSAGKPPMGDMLGDFALALQEVAQVTAFGCEKHGKLGGWRQVADFKRVYQNKKARHAIDALLTDQDTESGLHPLAHEAWNALALLQAELEAREDKP